MTRRTAVLHTTATLPNGLRMVHVSTASDVSWCGLLVDAGSRDDPEGRHGLAHFVEHLIFKGTTHRRAWHILNRMERVGGELNAYTTKEYTLLYAVSAAEHLPRAIELLADLVQWSTFPPAEMRRELNVVLEEAASYRDVPAEAVFDDAEDLLMAGSGLGHNILGNEEHLRHITRDDCLDYLKGCFVPSRMVLFTTGQVDPRRVFALAGRRLGNMHHTCRRPPRVSPQPGPPATQAIDLGLHQAHTVMGVTLPVLGDEDYYALMLLNNIVGGPGMNSLFNVDLRERRGLVYTVESTVTTYTDCTLFQVYFGTDADDVERSLKACGRILDTLAANALSPTRLEACKRQYCGQLTVAADSAEYLATNAARSLLYRDTVTAPGDAVTHIMQVDAARLQAMAARLALPRCSVLTLR